MFRKNNGVKYQDIRILDLRRKIGPSIHVDAFLEAVDSGMISVREAADRISRFYWEWRNTGEMSDATDFLNRESALEKVVYQLVNKEKNADILSEIPHKDFLDLAVIYRVIMKEGSHGVSSMIVTDAFCDHYSISREELDTAARRNTEKRGFCEFSLSPLLVGIYDMPESAGKMSIRLLTSSNGFIGAAVMLYKERFSDLANRMETDLYIFPSSIHEVIVLPADDSSLDFFKGMVREINASEVAAEDVLSDSVYRYSRDKGMLLIA